MTKDWLLANCIFVNLEHRLYLPEPVVPPMFAPRPSHPHTPLFLPSPPAVAQSPKAIAALSLVETPLSYTDLLVGPIVQRPRTVVIDENTVYLEDLT